MKRAVKTFLSLTVIAIFAALGAATAGDDEGSATETPASGGTFTVGQPISLGDTTVTISGVSVVKSVGAAPFVENAGATSVFVVVRYTEINNKNETLTVLGGPFKLRDSQARTFDPSSRAESALHLTENIEFLPQLQPGITATGAAVFEIPQDAANANAVIEFTERGFMGTAKATIPVDLSAGATL